MDGVAEPDLPTTVIAAKETISWVEVEPGQLQVYDAEARLARGEGLGNELGTSAPRWNRSPARLPARGPRARQRALHGGDFPEGVPQITASGSSSLGSSWSSGSFLARAGHLVIEAKGAEELEGLQHPHLGPVEDAPVTAARRRSRVWLAGIFPTSAT